MLDGQDVPDPASPELEFTGERFMPGQASPLLYYEHAHRYLLATEFARGKVVLDVACGEGYGAYSLAAKARQVIGLDNSPETIAHAKSHYSDRKNLRFLLGDAARLPFASEQFDLVVSFETIEHVPDPEGFLSELRRVVRPDGFVLLSTPDKAVHTEESQRHSDYHLKEFYFEEFAKLLADHFATCVMLGQKVIAASMVWPIGEGFNGSTAGEIFFVSGVGQRLEPRPAEPLRPMYTIAVCSPVKQKLSFQERLPSFFIEGEESLIKGLQREMMEMSIRFQQELRAMHHELTVRDQALARLNQRLLALEPLEAELARIKSGMGWALLLRLRRLRRALFPENTMRWRIWRLSIWFPLTLFKLIRRVFRS